MNTSICSNTDRYMAYLKELLFHKKINKSHIHLTSKYNITPADKINIKQLIKQINDNKYTKISQDTSINSLTSSKTKTKNELNDFIYNYSVHFNEQLPQNNLHQIKHNNGKQKIINKIENFNNVDNINDINILNHIPDKIKTFDNNRNEELHNVFSYRKLPIDNLRCISLCKKNKIYDNPIEHYFNYIAEDIQDPNHVVMTLPKPTRLQNEKHTTKFNL